MLNNPAVIVIVLMAVFLLSSCRSDPAIRTKEWQQKQREKDERRETVEHNFENGMHLIPSHMHAGVRRYLLHGVPMGNFGHAVFSNNLVEAYCRADKENSINMRTWAMFLYSYAPIMTSGERSWGSEQIVNDWCRAGGLNGIAARNATKQTEAPPAEELL